MILKVLLVIVVIAVVYFLLIKKKPEIAKDKKKTKNDKNEIQSDEMIECATCGTYVSIDDTILSNNKYYCSKECLEKR